MENKQSETMRVGDVRHRQPYNFGIQEFKRLLKDNNNLSKSDKNKAIKTYKKRIADRLLEIKKQIDEAQKERIDNEGK